MENVYVSQNADGKKCIPELYKSEYLGLPSVQRTHNCARSRPTALRDLVLTPERHPKFLIPSLGPLPRRTQSPKPLCSPAITGRGFYNSPCSSTRGSLACRSPCQSPLRLGPVSELKNGKTPDNDDQFSPVTRTAMSLPVPKITTPYGFKALGKSPGVQRRESLFFDGEARPFVHDTGKGKALRAFSPSCLRPRKPSYQRMDSGDSANLLTCDSHVSEGTTNPSPKPRSSVQILAKGRLQPKLKKNLAAVKTLAPNWLKRGFNKSKEGKDGCQEKH